MDAKTEKTGWDSFIENARADLDWSELERIKNTLPAEYARFVTYTDADTWFKRLWKEAVRQGLDKAAPQRILDLGTGSGHFAYVCRALGHDVVALERLAADLAPFHRWMRLSVVPHGISAFEPLPDLGPPFDLVTSWRVPFNKKRDKDGEGTTKLFGLEEWRFFLDDLRDNILRPGGRFAMKMNAQEDKVGLNFGDPELMNFFASRGGVPGKRHMYVVFDPLR